MQPPQRLEFRPLPVSVHMDLRTAGDAEFESGAATKEHGVWLYTATATAPDDGPVTVTATAKDRPGHDGTLTVIHRVPGA